MDEVVVVDGRVIAGQARMTFQLQGVQGFAWNGFFDGDCSFFSYIFQITCYYTVIRIFGIRETFVLRCFKVDVIPFHVHAFNVLKT